MRYWFTKKRSQPLSFQWDTEDDRPPEPHLAVMMSDDDDDEDRKMATERTLRNSNSDLEDVDDDEEDHCDAAHDELRDDYYPSSSQPKSNNPKVQIHANDNNYTTNNNSNDDDYTQGQSIEMSFPEKANQGPPLCQHQQHSQQDASPPRYRRLLLASNLWFVLGSVLYLVTAIDDMKWAKEAQSIPTAVLMADDDRTWVQFRTAQQETKEATTAPSTTTTATATTTARSNGQGQRQRLLLTYEDYDWQDLPLNIQSAAETLGFNETSWDNALLVDSSTLTWQELTSQEQAAAQVLGYNQTTWDQGTDDDDDDDIVTSRDPTPTMAPSFTTTTTTPPEYAPEPKPTSEQEQPEPDLPYDNVAWSDLPDNVRLAAQVLGYNQELYDADLPPRLITEVNPSWEELTAIQVQAAETVGYSKETWWYIRRNYDNFQVQVESDTAASNNDDENNNDGNDDDEKEDKKDKKETDDDETDDDVEDDINNNEEENNNSTIFTDTQGMQVQVQGEEAGPVEQEEDAQTGDSGTPDTNNAQGGNDDDDGTDDDGTDDNANDSSNNSGGPHQWYDFYWNELPEAVQQAFTTLGWTQDLWDTGGTAATDALLWDDLTPEQQEAALFLQYTQELWDGDVDNSNSESSVVNGTSTTNSSSSSIQWETYDWDDLPPTIQAAYQDLGYNITIWEQGGTVPAEELSWDELLGAQKAAALTIGYTKETWDNVDEVPSDGTVSPAMQWEQYYWNELPPNIQSAYQTLGYNEAMWNNDQPADTDELEWSQLSPTQQKAAMTLGYTQSSWDSEVSLAFMASAYVSEDDDYVFYVPSSNVWVSRYMILYLAAALCFVIVGALDFCRERNSLHMAMILAGLFGVVSAMIVERNRTASVACNLVSVHFFFLEGLHIIAHRIQTRRKLKSGDNENASNSERDEENAAGPNTSILSGLWWIPTVELTADFFFVMGALMDVVLSYFYFNVSSEWNMALARVFGFSTLLWLAASLLYLNVTLVLHYGFFPCCISGEKLFLKRGIEIDPRQRELSDMDFVAPLPTIR